jgi:hypothetical protein
MLKTEKVFIEINKGNIPIYSKNFSVNIGDILELDIKFLSKGSNVEIIAICDICDSEVSIKYGLYNKRFEKNGSFACCKKCAAKRTQENLMLKYGVKNIAQVPSVRESIKETNIQKFGCEHYFGSDISKIKNKEIFMEKYGVDNPLKSEEVVEKIKITNLERWGVEWTLQNDLVRDKIKKTSLDKWGTETPSQNQFVKNKIIKTNQERYGGNSAMCSDHVKLKSKETLLLNWGVDNPLKSEEIKDKIKKTNLDNLGVEYPTQSEKVLKKIKDNNLIKWGTGHVHQSDIYRIENTKIGSNEFYLTYKGDGVSIFNCDCGKDHTFEINTDNFFSRISQNIKLCTICHPINNTISFAESILFEFINSVFDGKIIQSYRDELEIDIYLPELKLGFEYNGLYWHSDDRKDKNYHINKTNHFSKRGIKIVHIWQDDWIYKTEIVKSQIRNMIRLTSNKIFARNCDVAFMDDSGLVKRFLNDSHIQGYVNSNIKIGLFNDGELVSVMTFDKFEGRKKMEDGGWNLSRFCNKTNTNVVGGASKMLNFFIKNINPSRIISYADRDWSNGALYYKLGFQLISESKPDYKYIVDYRRIHKSNYKKSKLKYNITESEYIKSNKIGKIWDCGKLKFEVKLI